MTPRDVEGLGENVDWWSVAEALPITRTLWSSGDNTALPLGVRETEEHVHLRCQALEEWLRENIPAPPEPAAHTVGGPASSAAGVTAVVGHSCVLYHTLGRWLANCEVAGNGPANMRAGKWDSSTEGGAHE